MAQQLGGDVVYRSIGPWTVPSSGAPAPRCPASVSAGTVIAGLPSLAFWGVCRHETMTSGDVVTLEWGELDVIGGGVIAANVALGISASNNRFIAWVAGTGVGPIVGYSLNACAANGDTFHALILPPCQA